MGLARVLHILESQIDALHAASWDRTKGSPPRFEPNLPIIRTVQSLIRSYYDGMRVRKHGI